MGFATISKLLMILILPFLIFLLVLNLIGFDRQFYQQKFFQYGVGKNISSAASLHSGVVDFIKGKANELPSEFGERERQHLLDVRKVINISTIVLYALIILFTLLLIMSIFTLKINNLITNFVGKILVFGGFLTLALAAILFLLINLDFPLTFESFHGLLFEKGTYVFDPAKEMLVKLYPEQVFMDLGIRISKLTLIGSAIIILTGTLLLIKSKKQK